MSVVAQPLINPKQAEASQTTQYTAPVGTRTIIDKFSATNTTASAATIAVNIVTSGGSAGALNLILAAKTIAPGECYTCPELVGHVLGPGDFISTIAGTASAITIRASGRQVS